MLDEFSSTQKEAPGGSGPGRPLPTESVPEPPLVDQDDFTRELQEGMAEMMREMESSPQLQSQFSSLMKDFSDAAATTSGTADGGSEATKKAASGKANEESFQETIRRTMERMDQSGEDAGRAAAAAGEDDLLAQMLKEMESGKFGGEETDEDFSKMLMGMMEQLTNKEILYEPMKELHDKFPAWLEKNKDTVPSEDLKRYQEQQQLVAEIVARFETSGYSDTNVKDREYIVDRMQKVRSVNLHQFRLTVWQMQAAGSPPPDLVGDLSAAQEALGDVDGGCPQQ